MHILALSPSELGILSDIISRTPLTRTERDQNLRILSVLQDTFDVLPERAPEAAARAALGAALSRLESSTRAREQAAEGLAGALRDMPTDEVLGEEGG